MLELSYLEGLPTPEAIDVVAEADALATIKAKFVELATSYGLDVTGIIDLEGEPGNIQLQAGAFREVAIRAAINDAVKANLLAFAACADLDHLAAFYDVIRLVDETDARLRARTRTVSRLRSAYQLVISNYSAGSALASGNPGLPASPGFLRT